MLLLYTVNFNSGRFLFQPFVVLCFTSAFLCLINSRINLSAGGKFVSLLISIRIASNKVILCGSRFNISSFDYSLLNIKLYIAWNCRYALLICSICVCLLSYSRNIISSRVIFFTNSSSFIVFYAPVNSQKGCLFM